MNITRVEHADWEIVRVDGQINTKTADLLQVYIDKEVEANRPLALDFSSVAFLSSAGLRALLLLARRSEEQQTRFVLVSVDQNIIDTMEVTGFLDFFSIYSNIDDLLRQESNEPED